MGKRLAALIILGAALFAVAAVEKTGFKEPTQVGSESQSEVVYKDVFNLVEDREFPPMTVKASEKGQKILDGMGAMTVDEILSDVASFDLLDYDYKPEARYQYLGTQKTKSGRDANISYTSFDGSVIVYVETHDYKIYFWGVGDETPYQSRRLTIDTYQAENNEPYREMITYECGGEEAKPDRAVFKDGDDYYRYEAAFDGATERVWVFAKRETCEASAEVIAAVIEDSSDKEIAIRISNRNRYSYNENGWFVNTNLRIRFKALADMEAFMKKHPNLAAADESTDGYALRITNVTLHMLPEAFCDEEGFAPFMYEKLDGAFYYDVILNDEGTITKMGFALLSNE